jgi:hypothetical protein
LGDLRKTVSQTGGEKRCADEEKTAGNRDQEQDEQELPGHDRN